MPDTADAYIHRIGRTGRAERTGDAFTLVSDEDRVMVRTLEKIMGQPLARQTLDGFDYKAPAPPRPPTTHTGRGGSGGGRQGDAPRRGSDRPRSQGSAERHPRAQRTSSR